MSEERDRTDPAVNPHTGKPVPPEPAAPGAPPAPREQAAPGGQAAPSAAPAAPAPATAAPSQQEMAIRSACETVMDPELGLSVVDLGLIREVEVGPGLTRVKMLLTTPFCPYAPQLMEEVKQAAMSVVPQLCEVELLPDPWSPDLMPDPGLLGFSY